MANNNSVLISQQSFIRTNVNKTLTEIAHFSRKKNQEDYEERMIITLMITTTM